MKQIYKNKKAIIKFCHKLMHEEELSAEERSIALIRDLQGVKKHKLREIEESEDRHLASDDFEETMNAAVDKLEDDLLEIEMRLQYALTDAIDGYKEKIKLIVQEMKDMSEKFIKTIDQLAQEFNSDLNAVAQVEFNLFNERMEAQEDGDDHYDEEEDKLLELLGDKEVLDSFLERSKEYMQKIITGKETLINRLIAEEQKRIDLDLVKTQHTRNRNIIREIIATCKNFRTEIKEDSDMLRGDEDD